MKTFPAGFTTEKNKKTGSLAVWILRLTVEGIDYWISDGVYTIPPGGPGWPAVAPVTTLTWVAAWGAIRESIGGGIGEILIADFTVSLLTDQDAGSNIDYLASTFELEQAVCQLYLWYDGLDALTDPPQMMFSGNIADLDIPDETGVTLTVEDEAARLQQYLGTRISREAYPLCDPDVVGKMIPIVYGPVPKLPALCVDAGWVSSLVKDITATQTMFMVSEWPAYELRNKTITIEDEDILIQHGGSLDGYRADEGSYGSAVWATHTAPDRPVSHVRDGDSASNGVVKWWEAGVPPGPGVGLGVTFDSLTTCYGLHIIALQDSWPATVDPWATPNMTGANYVIQDFDIYYLVADGSDYVLAASVRNNNKIICYAAFTAPPCKYIHVNILRQPDNVTRVVELAVYAYFNGRLIVQRGVNGTVPQVHSKGAVVIEKKSTPLVYLCADHALDSIGTVLARVRGINIDITSDCIKYRGTAANQLAAYPGKAAITIPDITRVSQRINLAIQDTIAVNDKFHSHATSSSGVPETTAPVQSFAALYAEAAVNLKGLVPGTYNLYGFTLPSRSFPAPVGTMTSCTVNITITCPAGTSIWYNGKWIFTNLPAYVNQALSYTFNPATDATVMQGNVMTCQVWLWSGTIYQMNATYDDIRRAGVTMSATRTYTYIPTTQTVLVAASPSYVAKTGTVSLSGNSVADIAVGDQILVDVTRNISTPAAVIGNLLATYANDTTLQQIGTLPAHFQLAGAITEYKRVIDWLDYLAWQCGCYFRRSCGVSRLIVRSASLTSQKDIPACCLDSEGKKRLTRKKAPLSDVVNTIDLLYGRDWSSSNGQADAYTRNASGTDPISVDSYGPRERPDQFMFDFVTSSQMAGDLVSLYLALYGPRPWRVSFSTFLDHCELEFGDCVTLDFLNFLVGQIVEAALIPGDADNMDSIEFTVLSPTIPQAPLNSIVTAQGDPMITNDRRFIIYAGYP